jgi:flagellar biosynthesis protein FlhA
MQGMRSAEVGGNLVVEPKHAVHLLSRLAEQSVRMTKGNMLLVLLCSPDLRRHLRSLSERVVPHVRILSMAEIPNLVSLKASGTVGL